MKKIILTILLLSNIYLIKSQCYPDRHNTNWFDAWVSCETAANPIAAYGNSHWILYDFGYNYSIYNTKFWNYNEPVNLDYGIENYTIDYSLDQTNWTNLGTFSLAQGEGSTFYQGQEGPDFEGITARYVLITLLSNYGGDCYGLAEVKFYLDESAATTDFEEHFSANVYPNPFEENINISINSITPQQSVKVEMYDFVGRKIYQKAYEQLTGNEIIQIPQLSISRGLYFIKLSHHDLSQTFKVIKQ